MEPAFCDASLRRDLEERLTTGGWTDSRKIRDKRLARDLSAELRLLVLRADVRWLAGRIGVPCSPAPP